MARIIIEGGLVDWKDKNHHQFIDTLESLVPLLVGSSTHQETVEYLAEYHVAMKNYLQVLDKALLLKNAILRPIKRSSQRCKILLMV